MNKKLLVKRGFLLLLLDCIDKMFKDPGSYKLNDIAERVGKSKQALNYHIQQLRKKKVIERIQSHPYSIYRLTSLGEQVKQSLIQSEHIKTLWFAHNLIVGFRILDYGNFRFIDSKLIHMNNWDYMKFEHDKYDVWVQETNLLKIYCPGKYTQNPDQAFGEMYSQATRLAQEYCDRYNMKLGKLYVIRKGQKSLVKSELLAKILGRFKTEDVWVDASEGTEELEENMDTYTIENILEMPKRLDKFEQQFTQTFTPAIEKLTQQIELHLTAIQELKNQTALQSTATQELRDAVKELKEAATTPRVRKEREPRERRGKITVDDLVKELSGKDGV